MPRSGACTPWVSGQEIFDLYTVQQAIAESTTGYALQDNLAICAEAAAAASDILYERSGRIFSGICGPVTIRPVARPTNMDQRMTMGLGGGWGVGAGGWGSVSWYGLGVGATIQHFGVSTLPEIPLGNYPVLDIIEVKIDGTVIPPAEYELRDYKVLCRLRTSATSTPTARWGWPTSQVQELPDTELGTFSITYTYGQDCGPGGRMAARKLAEFLVLPAFGSWSRFPNRVTSVSRQGVSTNTVDAIDMLEKGSLGIVEVEAWLMSVNPHKHVRQARVWSPDMSRPRRTGT